MQKNILAVFSLADGKGQYGKKGSLSAAVCRSFNPATQILTFDNERSTRHSSLNMSCFERCKIAVQSNLAALQSSQIWLRKYNILGIGLEFLYEINAAGPTPGKMTLVADKTRGI